jgi:hypothetical protein
MDIVDIPHHIQIGPDVVELAVEEHNSSNFGELALRLLEPAPHQSLPVSGSSIVKKQLDSRWGKPSHWDLEGK